jgi:hypothetical protein
MVARYRISRPEREMGNGARYTVRVAYGARRRMIHSKRIEHGAARFGLTLISGMVL